MKTYQLQFVHGIRIDNDRNCHNQLEQEITSFIASKRREIESLRSNEETGRKSKIQLRIESITQLTQNYTEHPPGWLYFLLIVNAIEELR